MQKISSSDMPSGLGIALTANARAMEYFSSLPENEKASVIEKTHKIHSRSEMKNFVSTLVPSDNGITDYTSFS